MLLKCYSENGCRSCPRANHSNRKPKHEMTAEFEAVQELINRIESLPRKIKDADSARSTTAAKAGHPGPGANS